MLRGCKRAVLFTVTFQARGFYDRHGYQTLGRIECSTPGHTRICTTKNLDPLNCLHLDDRGRKTGNVEAETTNLLTTN